MSREPVAYHLPSDYEENPPTSLDEASQEEYWTRHRRKVANRFQEPFYEWVHKVIEEVSPSQVADVGCGTAVKLDRLAQKYPDVEFIGIDQPGFTTNVRVGIRADFRELNLDSQEGWDGEEIGLVVCSDVIEHLSRPEILLELVSAMIGHQGVCMISTPDRAKLRGENNRRSPNLSHVREWTMGEFQRFLEDRGFEIIEARSLMPINVRPDFFTAKWLVKRMIRGWRLRTNQAFLIRNY